MIVLVVKLQMVLVSNYTAIVSLQTDEIYKDSGVLQ